MPSEDTKILESNQYKKSDKTPFIIYADLECIIEKINGCKNNPNPFIEHILWVFSISTISLCRSIKNQHDTCKGKDCIKRFVNP